MTTTGIDQAFYLYYSTVNVSILLSCAAFILHNHLHISIIWFHTRSIFPLRHIAFHTSTDRWHKNIFRRLLDVHSCAFFCSKPHKQRDRDQSNPQIENQTSALTIMCGIAIHITVNVSCLSVKLEFTAFSNFAIEVLTKWSSVLSQVYWENPSKLIMSYSVENYSDLSFETNWLMLEKSPRAKSE